MTSNDDSEPGQPEPPEPYEPPFAESPTEILPPYSSYQSRPPHSGRTQPPLPRRWPILVVIVALLLVVCCVCVLVSGLRYAREHRIGPGHASDGTVSVR